jgi:hypothetical protein
MVFFVCDGCNESLKKNQVDKHAMKCRDCWAVTCVDCSVTFPGKLLHRLDYLCVAPTELLICTLQVMTMLLTPVVCQRLKSMKDLCIRER